MKTAMLYATTLALAIIAMTKERGAVKAHGILCQTARWKIQGGVTTYQACFSTQGTSVSHSNLEELDPVRHTCHSGIHVTKVYKAITSNELIKYLLLCAKLYLIHLSRTQLALVKARR